MKNQLRRMIQLIMAVVMMTVSLGMVSWAEGEERFVTGTSVNKISIGGLTVEEAKAKMAGYYAGEYQLTLIRKGGTPEYIKGSEIGYQALVSEGLQEVLDGQNATGRKTGPAAESSYVLAVAGSFDEAALAAKIQSLACVSGEHVKKTANAAISGYQEGKAFQIIPEVYGNSVDKEKLTEAVKAALAAGARELDLNGAGCYEEVTVTKTDEGLKNLCEVMNRCREMTITYRFGGELEEERVETLTGEVIATWLTGLEGDGQIGVDREQAAAYMKTMAEKYDTSGTVRTFHTTDGQDLELTGPYGWKLNQEAETDALIGMIRTGQSQEREPQYTQTAASRIWPDWGNTYVEINLTGQHVYMYQEGTLVWDAPCVTGNVSKDYTTPPGIYGLTYKETDRILRGKKLADGSYEYESHVDFWMPFNGGIGLHDASWRSKFGGTIYQISGSHGCINLPPEKAKILYDLVYKGMPVICYNSK